MYKTVVAFVALAYTYSAFSQLLENAEVHCEPAPYDIPFVCFGKT